MLGDIVKGREKSSVVVLEDSEEEKGVLLEVCFISSLCRRVDEVHVLSFDRTSNEWSIILPRDSFKNVFIHDFSIDVSGWSSGKHRNVDTDIVAFLNKLWTNRGLKSVALVLDSMTHLLISDGAPTVCQMIKLLKNNNNECAVDQVLCILHGDLHEKTTKNLLHHISTTSLNVVPPISQKYTGCCDILHKRPSGKVIKVKECYSFSDTFEITDVVQTPTNLPVMTVGLGNQPDPTENLTFNLSLTDKEKEAKRQVTLPYTLQQTDNVPKSNGTVQTESKIFYQPDDADDFDEEDPDDDLSI